ncbi:MAG: methyltransferase domain-containing protein [Bacteroidales bacterium]|jgi:ubiquinone/menaquinone biosynthesis C-methylase UbiE|nr:methyltransferase domain-containing protein [Bacteroidales bacterium]
MKDRIAIEGSFWNGFSSKYDQFIKRTVGDSYQVLYKNLKNNLHKTDHVLEIATGTGLISFEICRSVNQINAIDIAPNMISQAKKKQKGTDLSNIEFEVGDSNNLQFSNNTFDKVIASNVLHLLIDPDIALNEMKRVLKPGGLVILPTFCHGENLKSRLISHLMSLFGFNARNKWSSKRFATFVQLHDFKVVKNEIIRSKIPLLYLVAQKSAINSRETRPIAHDIQTNDSNHCG